MSDDPGMRWAAGSCFVLLLAGAVACRAEPAAFSVQATPRDLFGAADAAALSKTLPPDREVTFRMRVPAAESPGVLVFVSATDSGELPAPLAPVLDGKRLVWVAADGYGNSRPTAERILVAIMALKLAQQRYAIDPGRRYLAGMSGGGRAASQLVGHFPQYFSGVVFIVGADYRFPEDPSLRDATAAIRMAFVTGSRDFNRREMRGVHRRYQKAGVLHTLFVDEPGFAHEMIRPEQLSRVVEFLDGS